MISDEYRAQLQHIHATSGWGCSSKRRGPEVIALASLLGVKTILDYGCGKGRLKPLVEPEGFRVFEYDPAIVGKDEPPVPADLVVVLDVMEHVEPEHLEDVLDHLHDLTRVALYCAISFVPAGAMLPDGRDMHLLQHRADWWRPKFEARPWRKLRVSSGPKHVFVRAYK